MGISASDYLPKVANRMLSCNRPRNCTNRHLSIWGIKIIFSRAHISCLSVPSSHVRSEFPYFLDSASACFWMSCSAPRCWVLPVSCCFWYSA